MLKDEYNDVVYEVDESGQVEILLPGNPDGGTVILATTDEKVTDDNPVILYSLVGIVLIGGIAFAIWKFRK